MMTVFFTDNEIMNLIKERKMFVGSASPLPRLKQKRGHKEHEFELQGERGHTFIIILRESIINSLDFCVILGYNPQLTNRIFRLRRYNGKSHIHSNPIEAQQSFYDFHIHTATERYQTEGFDEETYAEPTTRYSNIQQALKCLYADCNVEVKGGHQTTLPEGGVFT